MVPFYPKNMFLKKNEDITINIQQIVYFLLLPMYNKTSGFEKHDFWEFIYLKDGNGHITSDGSLIPINEGDVFFRKPGTVHSTIADKDSPVEIFCISFFSTSKILSLFENLKISLNTEQKELIEKMYVEAQNLYENGAENPKAFCSKSYKDSYLLGSYQMLKMYMETFLISIAREVIKNQKIIAYDSKESLETLIYNKTIEIISESVYSNITIDDICKSINYSRSYIYNIFKKHSGTSIIQYYNALKIEEAKKLIAKGKHSISEIAEMLNFNNSYYFSKTFKKHEKISPSEYKKKCQKPLN